MTVKVRYNNDSSSPNRWRVIVDNIEHQVDSVEINCKSFSSCDEIAKDVIKYHISCDAKSVSFSEKKGIKKVTIN